MIDYKIKEIKKSKIENRYFRSLIIKEKAEEYGIKLSDEATNIYDEHLELYNDLQKGGKK